MFIIWWRNMTLNFFRFKLFFSNHVSPFKDLLVTLSLLQGGHKIFKKKKNNCCFIVENNITLYKITFRTRLDPKTRYHHSRHTERERDVLLLLQEGRPDRPTFIQWERNIGRVYWCSSIVISIKRCGMMIDWVTMRLAGADNGDAIYTKQRGLRGQETTMINNNNNNSYICIYFYMGRI